MREQPPGAAASKDVEDGVQDLAGGVHLGTSGGFGCGQVRFEAAPFGVGKVSLVCFSHARYPTEPGPQNPFSDSFWAKFAVLNSSAPGRSFFDGAAPTQTRAHRSDRQCQRIILRHLRYPATTRSTPMPRTRPRDSLLLTYC